MIGNTADEGALAAALPQAETGREALEQSTAHRWWDDIRTRPPFAATEPALG